MAGESGRQDPGVTTDLFAEPYRFDFFQAVRLLEALAPRRPVGHDHAPGREAVRFRMSPNLAFPAATIAALAGPEEVGETPEMAVTFLGLAGGAGALPHHYASLLLRRLRDKDTSLRDWLDLFNHRLISFFYRAWRKYRLPFLYETARRDGGEADPVTQGLFCLVGLGTRGLRDRTDYDDEATVHYGGLFAHEARSALALEGILEDYFGLPVVVEQFHGQRLVLADDERSLLPGLGLPNGLNCRLGVDFVVGQWVWDAPSKFRLRMGPLNYASFRRFMPDGDGLRQVGQLARSFAGPEFSLDVQLELHGAEVPDCRLGGEGEGSLLGWNTWVHAGPVRSVVDDAVFTPAEA